MTSTYAEMSSALDLMPASLSIAQGGANSGEGKARMGVASICVENTAALAACSQVECRRWSHHVLVAPVEVV